MKNYTELKQAIVEEYEENASEYLKYFPMWNTDREVGPIECKIGDQVFVDFSLEALKVRYITVSEYSKANENLIKEVAESIELCLEAFGHEVIDYRIDEDETDGVQRVRIIATN